MQKRSDKQRILELLEREGQVDTFRLRQEGYSGNPSQRIRELKADGHDIVTQSFTRADGRRGATYRLIRERQLTFAVEPAEAAY